MTETNAITTLNSCFKCIYFSKNYIYTISLECKSIYRLNKLEYLNHVLLKKVTEQLLQKLTFNVRVKIVKVTHLSQKLIFIFYIS